MHSFTSISALFTFFFIIVANINVAAAQDKPKDGNAIKCDAQNILDACVKSTKAILESCPVQDWDCLCTQYNNVLTCYNNCPADQGRFAIESSKVANCNAAKQFGTAHASTSAPHPTATKATATTSGGGSGGGGNASQTSEGSKATGTGPRSSASRTPSPNAAAAMVVGGVEMRIGGLVWMLVAGIGYLV
ncbi:hypothetical protein GX50_07190 [[Emmonsia] crescens]|uniref:GPI anchored serine-threonine rich protein n=1 Tax=[Emmonsia] crescens TaxID=73230 RepID=A0A2B7Z107_9EURO|nr:hypothetical protein GX50_07190 [Emmonsia crescens]